MVKLPLLTPVDGLARVHMAVVEEIDAPAEGARRQGAVLGVRARRR